MGKLLDLLERASRGSEQPMGFRAAKHIEKVAPMLLLGIGEAGDEAVAKRMVEAGLHGAVFKAGNLAKRGAVGKSAKVIRELVWGVWRDEPDAKPIKDADFEVFNSDATPIASLGGEERTLVMQVSPELEDGLMRTLEDLPVDAFLVSLVDAPGLTVRQLMRIARVRGVTSKHLLVQLANLPSKEEQVQLRDVGVSVLLVEVSGQSAGALKECVAQLTDLPQAPPQRRSERLSATVPSIRPGARPERQDEEDDGDDEDLG
jgi:hypothetical protein